MTVDLGNQFIVPQEIPNTNLRPDIVLWSDAQGIMCFVELRVPWENTLEMADKRKNLDIQRLKQRQRGVVGNLRSA